MQNVSKTEKPANANDGHRCYEMHPALNKTEKPLNTFLKLEKICEKLEN